MSIVNIQIFLIIPSHIGCDFGRTGRLEIDSIFLESLRICDHLEFHITIHLSCKLLQGNPESDLQNTARASVSFNEAFVNIYILDPVTHLQI